ncbi:MAG: TRAFAC clade GTPase domain-containing protein [Mycobacteriaceae bacterium]|uniref:TRAFAC clade GTPase domain-containing protein n=1 Tax=Corynebacterium variabile TaxID=1727 RepID=UPI003FB6D23F
MTAPVTPVVRDPYTFRELAPGATTSADGRPLPHDWTDAHVHCVTMAGARASGKSLYTAVMVKQLEELASQFNRVVEAADDSTLERYRAFYEAPLYREMKHMPATPPASTADAYQRDPLIFSLGRWTGADGASRPHYLVFRDVAGEDLENLPSDPEELGFFHAADLIIFLFDPLRVEQILTSLRGIIPPQSLTGGDPEDVLRNLFRLLGPSRPKLAVTISKFDTLQKLSATKGQWAEIMGNNGAAFRRDSGWGYDHNDQRLLHMEIESLLRFMGADRLVNLIGQDYGWTQDSAHPVGQHVAEQHIRPDLWQYFAVSALGESPRGEQLSRHGIAPYRVLDPVRSILAPYGVFEESGR